jgi:hypothetical protein
MKIYQKERDSKYGKIPKPSPGKKMKTSMLVVLLVFGLLVCFFAGTIFGFDRAIKSVPEKPCVPAQCEQFSCEDINIFDCDRCNCEFCGDYVLLHIPVPFN